MKNKQIFGIASLALVALLMVSMVSAFYPAMGYPYDEEDMKIYKKIDKAVIDNDYDEWKNLIVSTLTKENFNELVESQKNMKKIDELSKKIMKAWEDGDEKKVGILEKELEKLSKELYGEDFFMASEIMEKSEDMVIPGIDSAKDIIEVNLSEEDQKKLDELDKKFEEALKKEDWKELDKIQKERDEILGIEIISPDIMAAEAISEGDSFWDAFRFW